MARQRQLPRSPDQWTAAERQEVIDVWRTFNEQDFGRRALDVLRRDLWDIQSAVGKGQGGEVLLDDRLTVYNEGLRGSFARIRGYLEAYEYLNMTEAEREEYDR